MRRAPMDEQKAGINFPGRSIATVLWEEHDVQYQLDCELHLGITLHLDKVIWMERLEGRRMSFWNLSTMMS